MKTNRNMKHELDPRYLDQQYAINKAAASLGLVVYRPSYHADKTDHNTVLIYTKEADEINRKLDKAKETRSECFARPICEFANTDRNGHFDLNFMNHGEIDLSRFGSLERILDHMKTALGKAQSGSSRGK